MKRETLKQAGVKHLGFFKDLGGHVLQDRDSGKLELWMTNQGHASYGILYRGKALEFVRTVQAHETPAKLKFKLWEAAPFNRFEIFMPLECAKDCSHSGDCGADVERWAPLIAPQPLNGATPDDIRAELQEYGAWEAAELADDNTNWQRIVWIAACNIMEEKRSAK
jgi:hypothetical protein